MFVYIAEIGEYADRGVLGVYLTLDEAWDQAYAVDQRSAQVTRYEVGSNRGEPLKWLVYNSKTHEHVIRTATPGGGSDL